MRDDVAVRSDAYYARASAWAAKGDYAKMLADLDKGAAIDPTRADFLRIRGTYENQASQPEAAKATLLALLQRVGIPNPARTYDAYPHQVSGGMAQRVLIAGAIASDPEFLIADEPTTALDVTVQADVLELLRELQAERGLGMVLVTHNFGVVADICDRVSVMRAGRIVESNTLDEIFANPQDPYTQMLLGSTLEGAPLRPSLSVAEEA
jgi:peptide/nickel transport system permease protein